MKKFACSLVCILMIFCTIAFFGCSPAAEQDDVGFVHAQGLQLLDGRDNPIGLMGTNLGGWLVQEHWMCPTSKDGEVFGQIDMMLTLANREDIGYDSMLELINAYEDSWICEQDFANIKALGLNCVRIPISYLNLCNPITFDEAQGKYVRTPFEDLTIREGGFDRLDWALEMCRKYDLYAIVDMHGAVGSQNGNDHSGDIETPGGLLWGNDETAQVCRDKTLYLWQEIAKRYKDNRTVAVYDILNEPNGENNQTSRNQWNYFYRLYDAIREIDPNHAITLEACWEVFNMPHPESYGWENVLYQYHYYNRPEYGHTNKDYYQGKLDLQNLFEFNVPTLIGEFCVWGDVHRQDVEGADLTQTDEIAWQQVMQLICRAGWSFTTWTYKVALHDSTWGLYNAKPQVDVTKADYTSMSKDEILRLWTSHTQTAYQRNDAVCSAIESNIPHFNLNPTMQVDTAGLDLLAQEE